MKTAAKTKSPKLPRNTPATRECFEMAAGKRVVKVFPGQWNLPGFLDRLALAMEKCNRDEADFSWTGELPAEIRRLRKQLTADMRKIQAMAIQAMATTLKGGAR